MFIVKRLPSSALALMIAVSVPMILTRTFNSHAWASTKPARASIINVGNGEDFQAALDRSEPGDVITLEAGADFVGNFTLPEKQNGSGWITIRSSAKDSDLPPDGHRVTPAYSAVMPRIISPNADPAMRTSGSAHHYQFVGIEITIADNVMLNYGIIGIGEGRERDVSLLPHHLVIDRCYIHGNPLADVARGIALNGANVQVVNSYISDCHGLGFDTQAICGWNSPGPFSIVNNYLEASGENVLFGGADPKIAGLVPSDIEFRRNHCFKPVAWKDGIFAKPSNVSAQPASLSGAVLAAGTYYYRIAARGRAGAESIANSAASDEIAAVLDSGANSINLVWASVANATEYRVYRTTDAPGAATRNWSFFSTSSASFSDTGNQVNPGSGAPPQSGSRWTVKNLFELKNARRVLIDENVFENNWLDGQSGFAILFTVRNQEGTAPWSVVEDVTFTDNVVRHSAAGIQFIGSDNLHPSQQIKRVEVFNNLFDDIGGKQWGNNGRFIQITETVDTRIDHNTAFQTGNLVTAHGAPNKGFVFINNIVPNNQFGIVGDGTASGNVTLNQYFPESLLKKNVIVGAAGSQYPGKNYYPAQLDEVGFVDRSRGNYRLAATSPFKKAGTRKKDIGANFDTVEQTVSHAIQGIP